MKYLRFQLFLQDKTKRKSQRKLLIFQDTNTNTLEARIAEKKKRELDKCCTAWIPTCSQSPAHAVYQAVELQLCEIPWGYTETKYRRYHWTNIQNT